MQDSPNLTTFVGKNISELRASRLFVEVYVFDHRDADHRVHFFRKRDVHFSATGVVVPRHTDIIESVLPGLATVDKKTNKTPVFRAEHCIMPVYRMLGEIAFRRWMADDDMREAIVRNYDGFVKNRDPLFYSLLVYHQVARLDRQPKTGGKGLWPFKVLTWDSDVRFQYRGKERYARRRLTYRFADNPRQASRVEVEYRMACSRRNNSLLDITLSRRYPIASWANTKTFMSQPENIPFLDALYNEVDGNK